MSIREKVEKFIESGKANQAEIEAVTKTAHEALNKVYEVVQRTGIPIQLSTPYEGWYLPSNFLVGTCNSDYYHAFNADSLTDDLMDEVGKKIAKELVSQVCELIGDESIPWEQSTC